MPSEKSTKSPLRLKCALFWYLALLSGCAGVTTPNTRECTVAGIVQAGMDCAMTNTGEISEMTFEEMVEWLEPQPERVDPVTGKTLPARAGAVCRSDDDFTRQKIALEQACELLKSRCTPELKAAIARNAGNVENLLRNSRAKKQSLELQMEGPL